MNEIQNGKIGRIQITHKAITGELSPLEKDFPTYDERRAFDKDQLALDSYTGNRKDADILIEKITERIKAEIRCTDPAQPMVSSTHYHVVGDPEQEWHQDIQKELIKKRTAVGVFLLLTGGAALKFFGKTHTFVINTGTKQEAITMQAN